jgi:hypothetical protein
LLDISVRRTNPAIPHALEAIVAKCLAVTAEERYADAGVLAEDLARFLQHQALVHAVNPSRRERCANWGMRHRLRLAIGAACLLPLAFLLGVVADRTMLRRRPLEPIASSPVLRDAVSALDEGRPDDSIEPLSRLAEQYAGSALPSLYLCIAHDARMRESDAERCFMRALAIPGAKSEMVAWGSRDQRLPERLDRFARRRFTNAVTIEPGGKDLAQDEGLRQKDELNRLAMEASAIAYGIRSGGEPIPAGAELSGETPSTSKVAEASRSDSDSSAFYLALAEQEFQKYESVLERVDRAMKSMGSQEPSDVQERIEFRRRLYDWRLLHGRALTKLAERSRREGAPSSLKKARECLQLADRDLLSCDRYVSSMGRSQKEKHQVEQVRVEAMMIRVEIDLDEGNVRVAKGHLDRARTALREYDELATLVDRRKYLDTFYQRMNAIERRFQQEASKKDAIGQN